MSTYFVHCPKCGQEIDLLMANGLAIKHCPACSALMSLWFDEGGVMFKAVAGVWPKKPEPPEPQEKERQEDGCQL